jgi:hypothetical protein
MVLFKGFAEDGLKESVLKRFPLGSLSKKDIIAVTTTPNAQEPYVFVALVIDREVPASGSMLLVKASVPPGLGAAAGTEEVARVLNLDAAAPPPAPRTLKNSG